jgi:VWFA-related protein
MSLRRLALPAAFFLGANTTPAQEPQPNPTPQVTIRTNVEEVVLDLSVHDAKGREVKNLKPGDIEIYEDGVKQDIRSLRLVAGKQALAEQQQQNVPSTGTVFRNPLPTTNLICLVFHNLDPSMIAEKQAIEAAEEFLQFNLQPGTWVGVFGLDTNFSVLEPFTTDRAALLRAAANGFSGHSTDFNNVADAILNATPNTVSTRVTFNGNPANGGSVSATAHIAGGNLNRQAIVDASVANGPGARAVRGDQADARRQLGGIESREQFDQMNEMFDKLGTLPGRKTVLLYSPGLLNTGDPDQFKAMIDRARKAGVTLYAIDANGLTENSTALASSAALAHSANLSAQQHIATGANNGAVTMEKARQDDYTMEAVRMTDTQAALRGLAEATGGFLIGSTNDYRKSYQRILEDIDTHYEAVYHPTSTRYDGHLRSIEVKSLRPGLTIESRPGYFALPPSPNTSSWNPDELAALTAINATPSPKDFSFHTAGFQFRSSPAETQHGLAFEIPASNFTLQPDAAARSHRLHLSLVSLVRDPNGQIVDQFAQDASFDVPDAQLPQINRNVITFTHPLSLGPGFFAVDTAIVDAIGQRASTSKFMFNNTPQPGLNLSSLMMVQRLDPVPGNKPDPSDPFLFEAGPNQWRKVVPELRDTFASNAKPAVYFVVYPDPSSKDKPQIEVEFRNNGQVVDKQTAPLPAPNSSGAIPMVVAAVAKPGKCELRVTAIQGNTRTMQSLYYTVVAR